MDIFIWIVNNCIPASIMIIAVLLLRYIAGKRTQKIMCILWRIVVIRLLCPLYIHSPIAIVEPSWLMVSYSDNTEADGYTESLSQPEPDITAADLTKADNNLSAAPVPEESRNNILFVSFIIWISGMIMLLIYNLISIIKSKLRLREAIRIDSVLFCDNISEAFVFGYIKPIICIPSSVDRADLTAVTLHEKSHISRKDNLKKLIWNITIILYWFNPLVWFAFYFYDRDLEIACDASVTASMTPEEKRNYAGSLLALSRYRQTLLTYRSFFSGKQITERISAITSPKKLSPIIVTCIGIIFISLSFFMIKDSAVSGSTIIYYDPDSFYASYVDADRQIASNYYPADYKGYCYPCLPQMSNWPYGNHAKMLSISSIPEEILSDMPTDRLLQSVLAYPLWADIFSYGDSEKGFAQITESFNGLHTLLSRSDFTDSFSELSQEMQIIFPIAYSNLQYQLQ